MLRFEKRLRNHGGLQVATEDTRGWLNYTMTEVWVDRHFFDRHGENGNVVDFSVEALNRFLEIYRRETGAYWVHRIQPEKHIPVIQTYRIRHDGGTDGPFILGTLGTGVGLGSLLTTEQDTALHQALVTEWQPSNLERFEYVAHELLDRGDYWAAALAAQMTLEGYVATWLRDALLAQGMTETEVDSELGKHAPFTARLEGTVAKVTGADIKACGAYLKWKTDARDLRNAIAHGKTLSVSREEAEAAVAATRRLLAELHALFYPA